jgi:hypothetical protein
LYDKARKTREKHIIWFLVLSYFVISNLVRVWFAATLPHHAAHFVPQFRCLFGQVLHLRVSWRDDIAMFIFGATPCQKLSEQNGRHNFGVAFAGFGALRRSPNTP